MDALLTKVDVRMALYAHRRTRGLLEGEYGSVFKGRSLDFEDLRAYVPGDDVADLDWKATARSPYPLVRRYVAVRKHTILLVVGTGAGMSAMADPQHTKDEVAMLAAGVLGWLALRHGDLVALVAGDERGCEYLPPRGTSAGLEQALRVVRRRCHEDPATGGGPTSLTAPLEYVVRSVRRRAIVVLVGDRDLLDARELRLIRRLVAQHEVLYLCLADLSAMEPAVADRAAHDVRLRRTVPRSVRADRRLAAEYDQARAQRWASTAQALSRLGVSCDLVPSEDALIATVFRLLERHRRARRG